jgi:hypothetical protein
MHSRYPRMAMIRPTIDLERRLMRVEAPHAEPLYVHLDDAITMPHQARVCGQM